MKKNGKTLAVVILFVVAGVALLKVSQDYEIARRNAEQKATEASLVPPQYQGPVKDDAYWREFYKEENEEKARQAKVAERQREIDRRSEGLQRDKINQDKLKGDLDKVREDGRLHDLKMNNLKRFSQGR